MPEYWKIALGIILLIYGITKLIVGSMALLLPEDKRQRYQDHPLLKYFITMDSTLAGKVLEVVLVIFAFYTIFDGLTFLGIGNYVDQALSVKLFTALGSFLVIFYSIVVYTSQSFISKDQSHWRTYRFAGIGAGLMFLMSALAVMTYGAYTSNDLSNTWWYLAALTLLFTWFAVIVTDSLDMVAEKRKEVTAMVMIPLSII